MRDAQKSLLTKQNHSRSRTLFLILKAFSSIHQAVISNVLILKNIKNKKEVELELLILIPKEEDFITHLVTASTHSDLLFFTDKGKAYQIKMYEIPEGKRATRGKSIMNFLSLASDEKVTSILPMPKDLKKGDALSSFPCDETRHR